MKGFKREKKVRLCPGGQASKRNKQRRRQEWEGDEGRMERQGIQGDMQTNTQRFTATHAVTCWHTPRGLKMHGWPSKAQRYN